LVIVSGPEEIRDRTKKFAIRIVRLFRALPRTTEAQVMGKQLLRRGTSVAANYRAVCRARSTPEFIARIGIVAEEADESVLWLELLEETKTLQQREIARHYERSTRIGSNPFRVTENGKG
jgi:four helix bundle protein